MNTSATTNALAAPKGAQDDQVGTGTALDRVVAAMEEDIVLGKLHPRERLIEEELCARFGVTRHILRQVFTELSRMGIVERIPNRGALVRAFSTRDVEQLYSLREMLETSAAAQIEFPVKPEDLEELTAIQSDHDHAIEQEDLVEVFRSNQRFHSKLFDLCGNAYLAEAIKTYAQRAHGIRFHVLISPAKRRKARDEHHMMIDAITRQDRGALIDLCRGHLPPSKNAYLRTFGTLID
ncbi:GntR family transcriptional regulator [Hoeflea sp. G2-23]|uniref:GntR family transcriptional regulator n=1 Tax=Hoeflea algicola TaxID=2983763 RepID=A0ABT3ZBV1_9HYPH|nr:GntR family transcriptional regulator [Hoeflea algicola]MCY0149278.1 GntR family transcriptional regulator [Hoeflea algicola]